MKRNVTLMTRTTDRMLGSVGLAKRRDPLSDIWLPSLALFAAGAVIGASAAVLLTPRSGPTMRRELTEGASQLRRKLKRGAPNGVSPEATPRVADTMVHELQS